MTPEIISTPVGAIAVAATADAVVMCDFPASPHFSAHCRACAGLTAGPGLTALAIEMLGEYFAGERTSFPLPLAPAGTPFQQQVWERVRNIAYGATSTYSAIAAAIGAPRSARAVAGAIGANPLPILIPCHRVLPSTSGLGGYSGGLAAKAHLLALEAAGKQAVI